MLLVFLLCACSSTKYVGENEFLLNRMKIKVEGGKLSADNLNDYVYQKPNADMLFIPKAGLHVYSLSGRDTSKLLNKMLRSIGSAPVVYDENATISTEKQLVKKMQNLGYLNAEAPLD